ncbi:MAG: hypothetical protein KKA73_28890 [Chloroflexi bacterium]|nr:hypothetical protein [Chloroflexota bacterium]MBU1751711.1 hypothetical protein [Chloroflexota bacterium]
MIIFALHCASCDQTVVQPLVVEHSTPHWARELWRQALLAGWIRDEGTVQTYCPVHRAVLVYPSTKERPLRGMPFVLSLYCDGCRRPGSTDPIQINRYGSRRLRDVARA